MRINDVQKIMFYFGFICLAYLSGLFTGLYIDREASDSGIADTVQSDSAAVSDLTTSAGYGAEEIERRIREIESGSFASIAGIEKAQGFIRQSLDANSRTQTAINRTFEYNRTAITERERLEQLNTGLDKLIRESIKNNQKTEANNDS